MNIVMGARQKHQRLKDGSPQDLNGLGKLRTQFDRKERERHRDYPHEKDNERFYRYRLFNFLHEHIKNRTFPSLTIEHYTELFEFKRRSYYD
ncbi:hypothetical protein FACS1894166_02950 [Bacilli bacterium]|nr:hypothetical protein FACS1894166_02950 [Bacilli bacterium]